MEPKVNEKIYKGIKMLMEKWMPTISSKIRGFLNSKNTLGLYW